MEQRVIDEAVHEWRNLRKHLQLCVSAEGGRFEDKLLWHCQFVDCNFDWFCLNYVFVILGVLSGTRRPPYGYAPSYVTLLYWRTVITLNRCGGQPSHECVANCLVNIPAKYHQVWSISGNVIAKLKRVPFLWLTVHFNMAYQPVHIIVFIMSISHDAYSLTSKKKTFASYLLNIFKYVQEISTISKITVNFISCVFQV